MRKIEIDMLKAIRHRETLSRQNTTVSYNITGCARVELHGNHIADVYSDGKISVDLRVLRRWPSPTTKSRLRALGVNVYTSNRTTYVDDYDIDEYPESYIIVKPSDLYYIYLRGIL